MKVLFIYIFLAAGLIIFGSVGSFANETTGGSANKGQTEGMKESTNRGATGEMTQGTTVINGKIADIQSDTIKIKDEKGNIQSIKLSGTEELENLRTQDLKAGDRVHVEMKDGKLVSLYKEGMGPGSSGIKEDMKSENVKGNKSATNTKEGTGEGSTAVGSSGTEETSGNTRSMSENMEGTAEGKQYTVKRGDTIKDRT